MIVALSLIWMIVFGLALLVYRRSGPTGLTAGGRDAVKTLKSLAIKLPCALLAAAFLVQIVPVTWVAQVIGSESGTFGIFLAALAGGLLPGGPMVAYPIAVFFVQAGAGWPQIVALLAGWSAYALNRTLAFEAPILGWHFVVLRAAACLVLPMLAGIAADLILRVSGGF